MKIIFLDIDGVLNCDDTPNPRKFPYVVDSRLLELFRDLVTATGAIVVLSSTWRVRKHPEVMRYVVLDDDDDCLDELPLFQPSSRTGLTPEIAKGIEDYLAGRSDKDMRASALKRLGQNIHAIFSRDKS